MNVTGHDNDVVVCVCHTCRILDKDLCASKAVCKVDESVNS